MSDKPEYPRLGASPQKKARIVFSPVNLTANGRAHLGHAGGPFLRMDVLSRTLKRAGHDVWSGLTTDGFENHVVLGAKARGEDPAAMAHRFYVHIREDLAAIGIRFDRFDHPSHPEHIGDFEAVKDRLLNGLRAGGKIALVDERLPVDDALPDGAPVEERFAVGAWFSARCPRCEGQAGSFFCEACGAHFEPSEALEPASRRGTITHWAKSKAYFVRLEDPSALPRLWGQMGVEAPFARIAQRYLDTKGGTMRLTVPGLYGLEWASSELVNRQICFSYSSLLYAHSLYCGDRFAERGGEMHGSKNAFAPASDAYLIGATGIDNTIPMLVGVSGCALAQNEYRPFDRLYFNYFLSLEGSKFSTSRGHVIWAGDIAAVPGLNVDLLRAYLSEICPEEEETDVRIDALVERHNALLDRVNGGIDAAAALLGDAAFDDRLLQRLDALHRDQSAALSLEHLRVSRALAPVAAWLEEAKSLRSSSEAYTWLKGLAFLAWPIMPSIGESLWHWLGHHGLPNSPDFLERPALVGHEPPRLRGRRLALGDLEPCLPKANPA